MLSFLLLKDGVVTLQQQWLLKIASPSLHPFLLGKFSCLFVIFLLVGVGVFIGLCRRRTSSRSRPWEFRNCGMRGKMY
jgi:hypothetical protein